MSLAKGHFGPPEDAGIVRSALPTGLDGGRRPHHHHDHDHGHGVAHDHAAAASNCRIKVFGTKNCPWSRKAKELAEEVPTHGGWDIEYVECTEAANGAMCQAAEVRMVPTLSLHTADDTFVPLGTGFRPTWDFVGAKANEVTTQDNDAADAVDAV